MRKAKVGDVLYWKGKLVKVVSTATGKVIFMRPILEDKCDTCGHILEYDALEDSPLFQNNAEPVETID